MPKAPPHRPPTTRVARARTEASVLRAAQGTYTMGELYDLVQAAGTEVTGRDDGERVIHGASDQRWKRRVRGALQAMKRQGAAHRSGEGVWVLEGNPARPRRAVLVLAGGRADLLELRLASACELLADIDEDVDLILTDPPYGLGVGQGVRADVGARVYARDGDHVVGGYEDVPAATYRDFTRDWVVAAAAALRPGGQLAVVTGPQQAAWVQVAAEDAGLTYVNSISVGKVFALRTSRRFAHAHWRVTVLCAGPLRSPARVFNVPADLPKARSGADYPQDLWPTGSVGRVSSRPGQLRYPNTLPVRLVDRLVGAYTRAPAGTAVPDLVCDPFVGGGTTAVVAARRGLRFLGGDVNPAALALTAARVSADFAPAACAPGSATR